MLEYRIGIEYHVPNPDYHPMLGGYEYVEEVEYISQTFTTEETAHINMQRIIGLFQWVELEKDYYWEGKLLDKTPPQYVTKREGVYGVTLLNDKGEAFEEIIDIRSGGELICEITSSLLKPYRLL